MNSNATSSAPAISAGSGRAWVVACRPATLTAAAVPVIVGTACAMVTGGAVWGLALTALWGALWIQIGTNLANDLFDYQKGADTGERIGPVRVVQAGLLTPRAVRWGMGAAFGMAAVAGIYLTYAAGLAVVVIGSASIASGILYTAGPFPLGYHGLGDLFVLIFFGFVAVCGTTFVQVGTVPTLACWAALPVGGLATAVLVVNNVRDRFTDAQAGKRTLAVRLGKRGALVEYILLMGASDIVPLVLACNSASLWPLLPLATIPWAVHLTRRLWRDEGRQLNAVLVGTAQLLLVHGGLWALGIVLGARG